MEPIFKGGIQNSRIFKKVTWCSSCGLDKASGNWAALQLPKMFVRLSESKRETTGPGHVTRSPLLRYLKLLLSLAKPLLNSSKSNKLFKNVKKLLILFEKIEASHVWQTSIEQGFEHSSWSPICVYLHVFEIHYFSLPLKFTTL